MVVWRAYMNALTKYPLVTQMISAGILFGFVDNFWNIRIWMEVYFGLVLYLGTLCGAGDVISQTLIEKRSIFRKTYLYDSTARFFALGCFFVAPNLRVWYVFLERYVHVRKYPQLTPLLRVTLDQLAYGPFMLSGFLILLRKIEGNSLNISIEMWRRDFMDIFKTGLTVWPAVQLINFYFLPLHHRILFVQTVALFWNTYLAWKTKETEHVVVEEIQTHSD